MKKYCIVNITNDKIVKKLEEYGYTCIGTEKSPNVSVPISLHADVLYNIIDGNFVVSDCQRNNILFLEKMGFNIKTENLSQGYKTECKLNFVLEDGTLLYNPQTATEKLADYGVETVVKVNQGYTKCSTVVLSANAFITEDSGIHKALMSAGKDCLLIEKGHVKLEGYDYGFIGGASVMLKENNTLLFFGNIRTHPDFENIINFCNKLDIKTDFICDFPLEDIGGAVIFKPEQQHKT